jgi:hypothetical protein
VEDEEEDLRALAWRLVDKLLPSRGAHASQRQLLEALSEVRMLTYADVC